MSDEPLRIRRIRPDEGDALAQLRLAALADEPSAFASTHEREAAWTDEQWAAHAASGSAGGDGLTLLAERDGSPIGLVGAFRSDPGADIVDLVSLWTAPSARRAGVGRGLVEAVVGWAADQGAVAVELSVTRGNARAQRLYETCGFSEAAAGTAPTTDPCRDEVRMRRTLPTGADRDR